jgi:hypothetical protein
MYEVSISTNPIQSLLYKGATTTVLGHKEAWFDGKNHNEVGYRSDDPVAMKLQMDRAILRGVHGWNVDWYGNGSLFIDKVTKMYRDECELRKTFKICLTFDDGMFRNMPVGGDPTAYLIAQIKYVKAAYMNSSQYVRTKEGRFLAFEFSMEKHNVDWSKIVPMFPEIAFVHRNKSGFSKPGAGGFSWLDSANSSAQYLQDFISYAKTNYPNKISVASAWPKFDDRNAKWTMNRVVDGRNGQLWLDCFSVINKNYSATNQLEFLQIVTENDYEEQTNCENGIDNGITLVTKRDGSTVAVSCGAGNTQTVDSFEVWVNDVFKWLSSGMDLSKEINVAGTYTVRFREVSKAGILSKWSDPVVLTARNVLEWL